MAEAVLVLAPIEASRSLPATAAKLCIGLQQSLADRNRSTPVPIAATRCPHRGQPAAASLCMTGDASYRGHRILLDSAR
jgi:hypothetical protein